MHGWKKENLNKGGKNKIMAGIEIRTGKPGSIMPVLDSAIRNQLKLLKTSINRTKIRISSFEQKYNMSTEQFMRRSMKQRGGNITCTEFVEANGKKYNNWIPARLRGNKNNIQDK